MNRRYHIVVVGGGVTGLMIATLLSKGPQNEALDITLVDAALRPSYDPDGEVGLRVSAIARGTAELFDSVAAWDFVEATRASPYESMRVWDENDSPDSASSLCFDAAEFAVPQLGFIVENALLQESLLQQLDATDTDLRFGAPIGSLCRKARQFHIKLEDGEVLAADLVIGADGARSFVRSAALGGRNRGERVAVRTNRLRHASATREATQSDRLAAIPANGSAGHSAARGRQGVGRVVDQS
jgi:2-polyprenyl-6-methoxyphenol hydroxylase-like FAD-dependent oxidoreductase